MSVLTYVIWFRTREKDHTNFEKNVRKNFTEIVRKNFTQAGLCGKTQWLFCKPRLTSHPNLVLWVEFKQPEKMLQHSLRKTTGPLWPLLIREQRTSI